MDSLHPPSFKILLESCLRVEIQVILPLWFVIPLLNAWCAAGMEFRVRGALKSNAWWFCLETLNIYHVFCDRMSQLSENSTSLSAVQPELFSSPGLRTELTQIIQFLPTQIGIPTLPTLWEYWTTACPYKKQRFLRAASSSGEANLCQSSQSSSLLFNLGLLHHSPSTFYNFPTSRQFSLITSVLNAIIPPLGNQTVQASS